MSETSTVTIDREDLIAEYVVRDAVWMLGNDVLHMLSGEDKDIYALMPGARNEGLLEDERRDALFSQLWPDDDAVDNDLSLHPLGVEAHRASAESSYIAARLMRAVVYHADYLRDRAQYLFELSAKQYREADEAEKARNDA